MSRKIENLAQYEELMAMLQKAIDTLNTPSTQGAHYLLISFLKTRYDIATNSREEAMRKARELLNNYDFNSTGSTSEMDKYADMGDKDDL